MKKLLSLFLSAALLVCCNDDNYNPSPTPDPGPDPKPVILSGDSNVSYQLLVYSFADSDGDGIGDFKGIQSKLDYLQGMGVRALWLSPIHPATSYHGYDVEDYASVNPEYGTEDDFKSLLAAAHAKGMKIYIDYVLNHSSKNHPWFTSATSSADSPYRDYYMISSNPEADVKAGKFPMMSRSSYNSGEWSRIATGSTQSAKLKFTVTLSSGKPSAIKVDKVETISNTGDQNTGIWLYYGDGTMSQFWKKDGIYSLSLELSSDWGVLVRTSTDSSWPVGTKYGGKTGANSLSYGNFTGIYPSSSSFDPADLLLPGMSQDYYLSVFGSYMPDINYGAADKCEESPTFKEVTEAADKWIKMGVDGFRLDAVKHIYHNASSSENPTFLKKFYDHCNASYKAAGHSDNIYMVGEHFSEAAEVAPYYKGLPAFFEFAFWWRLVEGINSSKGQQFCPTICGYHNSYAQQRTDWIAATKLTNHDEDRAGSTLGRSLPKMKLAAAVLLTSGGCPYIYQGEELGYWGTKNNGDLYVRTPLMWKADGSSLADKKMDGQIDRAMLSAAISVERQLADESSILSLYRTFGSLRSEYKALGEGDMTPATAFSSNQAIAAWYRSCEGQKILVVHNFGGAPVNTDINEKSFSLIGSNGSVTVNGTKLSLGSYASAIFLL